MPWAILGIVVALAAAGLVARRAKYYGRLFSDAHFREVYDGFVPALGPGRAFVTSAGLALAVTTTEVDDRRVLHVSLSQTSGYTTSAAAGRFGFFLVAILNRNKMSLDPFFTDSRVHHLVFASPAGAPLEINDFDSVMQHYRRGYRPLPYALRAIE
ncbi:MAG TPA: hypothetical protein VH853_18895 [Polyangia bacterium]|jgi:hypothetical protein|nr:hypothetical protein [Polyangia bacterium]